MRKAIKTWFPIKNIENGIIQLKDGRFCKVLEVYPINFSLKSISEQENILYLYKNFLHTCNFDIQILVYSRKGNLDSHIAKIQENMKLENNEKLISLMKKYLEMLKNETLKSAITKRFFIVFNSDLKLNREQAVVSLLEKSLKIKTSIERCGNVVKDFSNNNDEIIEIIYAYINPITSQIQDFKEFNYEYKG